MLHDPTVYGYYCIMWTNAIITGQQKLGVDYYLLAYFSFVPSLCG